MPPYLGGPVSGAWPSPAKQNWRVGSGGCRAGAWRRLWGSDACSHSPRPPVVGAAALTQRRLGIELHGEHLGSELSPCSSGLSLLGDTQDSGGVTERGFLASEVWRTPWPSCAARVTFPRQS